jgi:hypothetical protein
MASAADLVYYFATVAANDYRTNTARAGPYILQQLRIDLRHHRRQFFALQGYGCHRHVYLPVFAGGRQYEQLQQCSGCCFIPIGYGTNYNPVLQLGSPACR